MKSKKIKCEHCNCYFIPNKYNYHRQRYCSRVECQHVSRISSRRKYRKEDKNCTPPKRQKETERVKRWQKKHPDYKKRQKKAKKESKEYVLRDIAPAQNSILRDIAQLKSEVSLIPELGQKKGHTYTFLHFKQSNHQKKGHTYTFLQMILFLS